MEGDQKGLDIQYTDFLKELQEKNPEVTHKTLIRKVAKMCAELTYGLGEGIEGLKAEKNRFGVYGVDVMITESEQVKLLEVTVSPDCERAQRDHPDFWKDVFDSVFRKQVSDDFEVIF